MSTRLQVHSDLTVELLHRAARKIGLRVVFEVRRVTEQPDDPASDDDVWDFGCPRCGEAITVGVELNPDAQLSNSIACALPDCDDATHPGSQRVHHSCGCCVALWDVLASIEDEMLRERDEAEADAYS